MDQLLMPAAQLGGTVFTVVIFLRYITTRDRTMGTVLNKNASAQLKLAHSLQKLTDKIDENTITIGKNISITKQNTNAVSKVAKIVKKTNGE